MYIEKLVFSRIYSVAIASSYKGTVHLDLTAIDLQF